MTHIVLHNAHLPIFSSAWGQVVNSSDQSGLLPNEPIDPSAPQRHGEYNYFNSYWPHVGQQVRGAAETSGPLRSPALAGLICFTQPMCEMPILMHYQYNTRDV